jgi:hypothetical protein
MYCYFNKQKRVSFPFYKQKYAKRLYI